MALHGAMTPALPSKPERRPARPQFSSGPTVKPPGWSPDTLTDAVLGRSHRTGPGRARLQEAVSLTREVLEIPADYRIGITPGSDTGAVELALWNLLGGRPVQLLAYEFFGQEWADDARDHLHLDCEVLSAPFGELSDLSRVRPDADVVFAWNGTTSGVRVPIADFIAADRTGLTICDATSAAFAQPLEWDKLDVTTFSWQKALGGEAAHGMIVMSPRALERLAGYTPPWPLPKVFRLKTKTGAIDEPFFDAQTINTPSLLCTEDWIAALKWARDAGGVKGTMARADANAAALFGWVDRTAWVAPLAGRPEIASNTSVCLKIVDPDVLALEPDRQKAVAADIAKLLDAEGVAFDINAHRAQPAGLRVWCGSTVDTADIEALTPWLDWAFATVKAR